MPGSMQLIGSCLHPASPVQHYEYDNCRIHALLDAARKKQMKKFAIPLVRGRRSFKPSLLVVWSSLSLQRIGG